MATELIADPIVSQNVVPQGMGINPVLDWSPVLGIPLWVFMTFFVILIFISVIIYWFLRIGRMASVKGYVESLKKLTQDDIMVWIISRTQRLTIECMTIKDNVTSSHDPDNLAMWHINSAQGIIQVGGIKGPLLSEDFDQNRDIVVEIALCHNADMFNEEHEQYKAELKRKYDADKAAGLKPELPVVVKPIHDYTAYDSYGRKCLEATSQVDGLAIPPYNLFDPTRFKKYFPLGCSAMFFGGELIHDARGMNIKRKEKGFWEVHGLLVGAIAISIIALVAAWLAPMGV